MDIKELNGKSVYLYPDNFFTKQILQINDFIDFPEKYGLAEKNPVVIAGINIQSIDTQKITKGGVLFVTECSPCTMLLPPGSERQTSFRKLLHLASQKQIPVVSPFTEMHDMEEIEIITGIKKFANHNSVLKKSHTVVVLSTSPDCNRFAIEVSLKRVLEQGGFPAFVYSFIPPANVFFPLSPDMKQCSFVIIDGPDRIFSYKQGKNSWSGSFLLKRFWNFIHPDAVLLAFHKDDSYQMLKENIDYITAMGTKVIGLVENRCSNPWFHLYIEGKLGIPTASLADSGIQIRNIVLRYFTGIETTIFKEITKFFL